MVLKEKAFDSELVAGGLNLNSHGVDKENVDL
jgi:hypothetical protein